jgi:hypothetical protein
MIRAVETDLVFSIMDLGVLKAQDSGSTTLINRSLLELFYYLTRNGTRFSPYFVVHLMRGFLLKKLIMTWQFLLMIKLKGNVWIVLYILHWLCWFTLTFLSLCVINCQFKGSSSGSVCFWASRILPCCRSVARTEVMVTNWILTRSKMFLLKIGFQS